MRSQKIGLKDSREGKNSKIAMIGISYFKIAYLMKLLLLLWDVVPRLAAGMHDWDNPTEPDHPIQVRAPRDSR